MGVSTVLSQADNHRGVGVVDQEKFKLLRKVLRAIGLSPDAVDDLVDRVVDLLSEKPARQPKFPYHLRDAFLSPAEHNFYLVIKKAVQDQAIICPIDFRVFIGASVLV